MVRKVLAVLLLFICFRASAEEQRCTELGSNCDCSEPLGGSFSVTDIGGSWLTNPDNSVGDLQCGNSTGDFFDGNKDPNIYLTNVPASGMPAGSSVTEVYRWSATTGIMTGSGRTDKVTSTTRRLCQRVYMKFSSDFSRWTDCNNKIMEMVWHNNGSIQSSTSAQDSPILLRVTETFPNSDFGNHFPGPDQIGIDQCITTWCRIELCVSGNIQAGTNMTADFYVSTTDGQLQASKTGISLGDTGTGTLYLLWPLNIFREPAFGTCQGYRELSHVMQASWDTDSGQTIGPAYEIEGSGGGQPARKHLRGGGFSGGALK